MSAETGRIAELENPGYELFIVGLSIVSLVNFVLAFLPISPNIHTIAQIVDAPISVIFLIDFSRRLLRSHPRRSYFIKDYGWLDLLGSLPFAQVKIFRVFRLVRILRLLRVYGARRIVQSAFEHRADNALLTVLFLVLVLLEFGSMSVLAAEQSAANSNIKTGGEALWWAFVSITTVGYGDYYPVTNWGRIFAIFVLAAGVGLFGVLSGFLANFFLAPSRKAENGESPGAVPASMLPPGSALQMLDELEAQFQAQIAAIRLAISESPETG